jgi:hypothetical protein
MSFRCSSVAQGKAFVLKPQPFMISRVNKRNLWLKEKKSKGQTEYKGQFVCHPYVSNRVDFQDFVKNLGDGDLLTQIALGFPTIILGMALVAQVTSRTKNISLGNHFQLDSINFYKSNC